MQPQVGPYVKHLMQHQVNFCPSLPGLEIKASAEGDDSPGKTDMLLLFQPLYRPAKLAAQGKRTFYALP